MLRLLRTRSIVALGAVTVLMLAGCSSGEDDTGSEASPTATAGGLNPEAAGDLPGGGGVSGLIASVTDSVMQVQATDSQTAVTWTADTVVTRTVAATIDKVAVGSCVVGMGAAPTGNATSAPTADSTSSIATRVSISQPVDGVCSAGFPGARGGGQMPDGARPTALPEGGGKMPDGARPTALPEGGGQMPDGGFGGVTAGLVTAVAGTTITVEATDPDGATTSETITVDSTTTYTATEASDASAIAVGLCATAQGEDDTSGGMTATSIVLSDAGENGCSGPGGIGMRPPSTTGTSNG